MSQENWKGESETQVSQKHMQQFHLPVMLDEVLRFFNPESGDIYVDCTLGGAGHGLEIIKRLIPDGLYVGIDRDEDALSRARQILKEYMQNVILVQDNFANLRQILSRHSVPSVNGILLDLGVSSHQLDVAERGFTYREDAPLDMRMDPGQSITAADIVNELSVHELTQILRNYGEERWAARIAKQIVGVRQDKCIRTTSELVDIIKNAIPAAARRTGPHPARRSFQALRIAVNNELESLKQVLSDAVDSLSSGGKICVISYHSLEDRIVKQVYRDLSRKCDCPPGLPVCVCDRQAKIEVLTRKPIEPSDVEVARNPRSRSAKLRVAMKL